MEDRTSLVHVIAGVVVQSCHSKGIKKKSHVETESWPPIMKNPKLFSPVACCQLLTDNDHFIADAFLLSDHQKAGPQKKGINLSANSFPAGSFWAPHFFIHNEDRTTI